MENHLKKITFGSIFLVDIYHRFSTKIRSFHSLVSHIFYLLTRLHKHFIDRLYPVWKRVQKVFKVVIEESMQEAIK